MSGMEERDFNELLEELLTQGLRYPREAYGFVREALDHTQRMVERQAEREGVRHVSGQQLLEGIRDYALRTYGPMAATVLEEWGVRRCEDFGEIVFDMVDHQLLAKTPQDTREDFKGGYDFEDAFRKPYRPRRSPPTEPPPSTPPSTQCPPKPIS